MVESNYISDAKRMVIEVSRIIQCNCDLDDWGPEWDTQHTASCPIHRLVRMFLKPGNLVWELRTEIERLRKVVRDYEKDVEGYFNAFCHFHANNQVDDVCARCGLDLRDPIHLRAVNVEEGYARYGEEDEGFAWKRIRR